MAEAASRPRRRRGEAKQAILDAARELFTERGYDGASIRDIARRSSTSETLIFRNFGTKDRLFDAAVAQPFREFIADFATRWRGWIDRGEEISSEAATERWIGELYEFASAHRDLLFTLVATRRFVFGADADDGPGIFEDDLAALCQMTAEQFEHRGIEHPDVEMVVSCNFAMVLGMVLLDDAVLQSGRRRPSKKRIIDQLGYFAVGGTLGERPARPRARR